MPDARKARRLGALARPLTPARAPYYVRLPVAPGLEDSFPAEGWYWIPAGHHVAVYLAASFDVAAVVLHRLIRDQEMAAA